MHNLLLRAAAQASTEQVVAASRLMHSHWEKGGSVAEYQAKLTEGTTGFLPQSYVLILNDGNNENTVVAHGRLVECFESAGGNAAALTYIIAEPQGKGYGSQLIAMLEEEAIRLGYHYLYLWTTTAVPFYLKLGYHRTERVSLYSPCLKRLKNDQVSKLEAVLQKKMGNMATKRKETVMLPPGDEASSGDIWMRKRLVECVGSEIITAKLRLLEIQASISQYTTKSNDNVEIRTSWKYFMLEIPWQQQVGPSCGLAALRMLRDYYVKTGENCNKMPSLLAEAQRNGYTVDGEIFDASNMVQLATFCGLQAELKSLKQTPAEAVFSLLRQGCTIILPYDSQPSTRRPHRNAGKTAHYGIVVGIMYGFQISEGNNAVEVRPFRDDEYTSHAPESLDNCHLLVQHSLSGKLAIAPWSEFYESNQQLTTIDSTKYKAEHLNLRDCVIVCKGAEPLS